MLSVNIHKELPGFTLSASFVHKDGCLGILGPSGCGKSMTLKSIAGILTPDDGEIYLGDTCFFSGERKINLKPQIRKTGYLFQNYALFPSMTVEENVAAGLSKRDPQRKEKTNAYIRSFRLNGLEKRYPAQISGGQQQRTALARTLICQPDLLLLDEPFSALDTHLKEEMRMELYKTLKNFCGLSMMVSHDRDEIFQFCSNLLIINEGKILCCEKTEKLFFHPPTVKSAEIMGYKNISPIEKLGPRLVRALKWNLNLTTDFPISSDTAAVGIRSGELMSVSDGEEGEWPEQPGSNLIPVGNPSIMSRPFEWDIVLANGLWWRTPKTAACESFPPVLPKYIRIPPGKLLPLQAD